MTLILKSKSKSTGLVGNVHGNTGPQDYVAMLDFSRSEYFTRVSGVRTDYDLNDLIAVARSTPANYQDRDGVWRASALNSPRFKHSTMYDAYGLFVGASTQNYAASATDGSLVSIPASGATQILLSWEGSGAATLTHANITDNGVLPIDFKGRKARWYTRTVAGAFTPTLNVTGSVSRLQVEFVGNMLFPGERVDYGATVQTDAITFKAPLLNRIGANGSVFLRTTAPDARMVESGTNYAAANSMIALRNGLSDGGIYLPITDGFAVRPNGARRVPDGSAYAAGTTYVFNVSGRPSGTVRGLGWTNYGSELTGMTGGMFLQTTGLTSLSAFNAARIGGDATGTFNGIITHCVIYDRHLSYDEMSVMATMWQN